MMCSFALSPGSPPHIIMQLSDKIHMGSKVITNNNCTCAKESLGARLGTYIIALHEQSVCVPMLVQFLSELVK